MHYWAFQQRKITLRVFGCISKKEYYDTLDAWEGPLSKKEFLLGKWFNLGRYWRAFSNHALIEVWGLICFANLQNVWIIMKEVPSVSGVVNRGDIYIWGWTTKKIPSKEVSAIIWWAKKNRRLKARKAVDDRSESQQDEKQVIFLWADFLLMKLCALVLLISINFAYQQAMQL